MRRRTFVEIFLSLIIVTGAFGVASSVLPASAQVSTGLAEVGATVKLPSTDPRVIAVRIINIALGLIGIILVSLILYAGFLYMTSGGAAEKTATARKIIINAVIGLVIILSAWAITRFVIDRLLSATRDGGAVTGEGGGGGLGAGFVRGGGAEVFRVKAMSPAGSIPIRNVQVKIILTKAVDPAGSSAIVVLKDGGTAVAGTVEISGSVVTFTPTQACPAPHADRTCFDANTKFLVKIGSSLRSVSGQAITCSGFGSTCEGSFRTGSLVDTKPPTVKLSFPTDGMSVQVNSIQSLVADAEDDAGIAAVEFFDGPRSVGVDGPTASTTPRAFTAKLDWLTSAATLGPRTLSAVARDIDRNVSDRNSVSVVVRPEHCFNGKIDPPSETGIDCGGDATSAEYCGACAGGSCTKSSECASGFCVAGACVVQPIIHSVSPLDGKIGTFVTLRGTNFGYTPGVVTFLGGPGTADDRVAAPPSICTAAGAGSWSNTQAIVEVPASAASGPIQLKNGASGLFDATNDAGGPVIPNFLVNDRAYPGLCAISPTAGFSGSFAEAVGQEFGSAGKIIFSTEEKFTEASVDTWSRARVRFKIPVADVGDHSVSVKTSVAESNKVRFSVIEKILTAPPVIRSIDPGEGPPQQYVTLFGSNFGFRLGKVTFTAQDGSRALADTSFPSACGDLFWRDDRVVMKVPSVLTTGKATSDGTYRVQLERPDASVSNNVSFTLNASLKATPGICAIQPSLGPKGTFVKLIGDRFGIEKPFVTFYLGKAAVVSSHTNQEVNATVPDGTLTGPVFLNVAGVASNKVNFQVQNCNEASDLCAFGKERCCPTGECRLIADACGGAARTAMYAWQTSTGRIPVAPRVVEECATSTTPSPSPWIGRAGGDRAPVDASVFMRFSHRLQSASIVPNAFQFFKCTSASSEPCATQTRVDFTLSALPADLDQHLVELLPVATFATGTTYEVKALSTIRADGPDGAKMDPLPRCGTGPKGETYGYCFRFTTKGTSEPSKVGSVQAAPMTYVMRASGETAPYRALPLDAADQCIVLNCRNFDWTWYTGTKLSSDSRASVTNLKFGGKGLCEQTATGIAETLKVPVPINAEITPTGPVGRGNLYVNFLPPKVETFFPNCQQACSNALVWAQFSSELDEASVKRAGNVEIRKCLNENCMESDLSAPLSLASDAVALAPVFGSTETIARVVTVQPVVKGATLLEPGAFYRVLLRGGVGVTNGIKGKNGVPMDGANHPLGFQWTFRVKLGIDAVCKADRIDVVPPEKYETVVGARQVFTATAFGKPDECSANGQTIVPLTPAIWSSSDTKIADMYRVSGQLIDTGAQLPAGCSSICRATGASAQFGKVAVCGNGTIETTDPKYCALVKSSAGGKCVTVASPAAAGEECEPAIHGALCNPETCLFYPVKPVTQPGGTCGDGVVEPDKGEACDFGLRCVGGSKATSTAPVPEYAPCVTALEKAACSAARGSCGVWEYRGCSANCRHLGSIRGASTCGNSDSLGDGKDCDDGNTASGDGCSSICLHEGAASAAVISSLCGNGILEPGETCERSKLPSGAFGSFPSGCDVNSCLHTGSFSCTSSGEMNCCGNGKIEAGEDCDDGNSQSGDGCNFACLLEGSSAAYSNAKGELMPSFCGNGVLEQGEQCESGGLTSDKIADVIGYTGPSPSVFKALSGFARPQKGDGRSDPKQLAFILGEKLPDETGVLTGTMSVTMEGQTGKATYGLRCGFKDENACPGDMGLDQYGCCAPRPKVEYKYPSPDAIGVCRNVLIQGGFNAFMDPTSVINNFEISEATTTARCAPGTKEVLARNPYAPGVFGWIHRLWDRVISVVTGRVAYAEKWCTGGVTGQLVPVGSTTSTKRFAFTLDRSLAKNIKYRIRFIGDASTSPDSLVDNADVSKKWGVKTQRGVVRANTNDDKAGPLIWTFMTGEKICSVSIVTISDTTPDPKLPERPHPFLFTNKENKSETRSFSAQAQSIQSGVAVPLSATADYLWSWLPWTSGNTKLISIVSPTDAKPSTFVKSNEAQLNGTTMLTAGIEIQTDTVNVPPTTKSTAKGVAPVTVLACERPWPSREASPLKDAFGSPNFKPGDPFFEGPLFYNFSTMYCRDAGVSGESPDVLPSLEINQVKPSIADYSLGILRQYLFTYPPDSALPPTYAGQGLKQDGIGIRIIANPQHLSPEEWYAARGFKGSPSALTIDGYPAIKDGTTIYVAATNRPLGSTGKIYSNIYLISYNQEAKPVTVQIYDQMVKYLTFNINKEFTDQSNVCVKPLGAPFTSTALNGGAPISCLADWECLQYDPTLHCDSTKWKLVRDTLRLTDFQYLTRLFEQKKDAQGRYPQISGGSFLQSQSNSIWSSWNAELGQAAGSRLPADPINRFLTCGQCEKTKTPCQSAADCQTVEGGQTCKGGRYDGGVWKFDDAIDPQSCWNQTAHAFICPRIPGAGDFGISRLYRYLSLSDGLRYDLGAEFELPPVFVGGKPILDQWWSPPLAQARYLCANPPVQGMSCANFTGDGGDDRLCRPCPNGNCSTCQSGKDAGQFCGSSKDCEGGAVCAGDTSVPVVVGSCKQVGGSLSFSNICQNVPVGDKGRCGDGVVQPPEVCEVGMTRFGSCKTTTGENGQKKQMCDLKDCSRFIDDPLMPQCVADVQCGNGRIEKGCVGGTSAGVACTSDTDCAGGGLCKAELCDDGALNGKYGKCNLSCTGYASYCGDGEVAPGELCDFGLKNGDYCSSGLDCLDFTKSCGLDCKSSGPYCGDRSINGSEECDGQTEATTRGLCILGIGDRLLKKTCTPATELLDCGTKGGCATKGDYASCEGVTYTDPKTGIIYQTQRTRTCQAPGAKDPKTGASLQCTFSSWSACEPKGRCGDGIKDSGEACDAGPANSDTGACTTQCQKNVCGDGKLYLSVEECDNGKDNGSVTCSADYGSSCLSCTKDCKWQATAGGYCGDAVKNGPEQCDGTQGLSGVTCESIGYDFGTIVAKEAPPEAPLRCQYTSLYQDCTGTGCAELNTLLGAAECKTNKDCQKRKNVNFIDYKPFNAGWTVYYKDAAGTDGGYAADGRCVAESPSCNSSCTYTGCARCSDPPEEFPAAQASIFGSVRDGVFTNQPVPNARVTLLYRGVKVAETYTKDTGKFSFAKLHSNVVCNSYKIVVDFYGDNPKTTEYDESVAGGYWPYTSNTFAPKDFYTRGIENDNGAIFLLPRVRKYETLVFVNWLGDLTKLGGSEAFVDAHLIFPYGMKATWTGKSDPTNPDLNYTYAACPPGSDCVRDLQFKTPGLKDLSKFPHARIYCYTFGSSGESCTSFNQAPEVLKYSRKFILTSSAYDFYLVDWENRWRLPSRNYMTPLKLSVTVVTPDGTAKYTPKERAKTEYCGSYKPVWHVYSQDAFTGEISQKNEYLTKEEAAAPARNVTSLGTYLIPSEGLGSECAPVTLPSSPPPPSSSGSYCETHVGECCDKGSGWKVHDGCVESACKGSGDILRPCKPYCSSTITIGCCEKSLGRTACIDTIL